MFEKSFPCYFRDCYRYHILVCKLYINSWTTALHHLGKVKQYWIHTTVLGLFVFVTQRTNNNYFVSVQKKKIRFSNNQTYFNYIIILNLKKCSSWVLIKIYFTSFFHKITYRLIFYAREGLIYGFDTKIANILEYILKRISFSSQKTLSIIF